MNPNYIIFTMGEIYRSESPSLSRSPSPWPFQPPSDSPSPSSSFRVNSGDRARLLARKHTAPCVRVCHHQVPLPRASSLDDVRVYRSQRQQHHRSASARSARSSRSSRSARSARSEQRRRRSSACSTRSASRRASTAVMCQIDLPEMVVKEGGDTVEDLEKTRRHRIAFWMVLGSFIFIAVASILVVVVTLTHTSQYNNTLTYYTFAKPSVLATNLTRSQRK